MSISDAAFDYIFQKSQIWAGLNQNIFTNNMEMHVSLASNLFNTPWNRI